jgi:hypothetical protein
VTFTTLQALSKYSDLLIRISHALQLNISVLDRLSETATRRQKLDSMKSSDEYEAFQDSIRTCITEHHFLKHHVSLVQSCAQEITVMVGVKLWHRLGGDANNLQGSEYDNPGG